MDVIVRVIWRKITYSLSALTTIVFISKWETGTEGMKTNLPQTDRLLLTLAAREIETATTILTSNTSVRARATDLVAMLGPAHIDLKPGPPIHGLLIGNETRDETKDEMTEETTEEKRLTRTSHPPVSEQDEPAAALPPTEDALVLLLPLPETEAIYLPTEQDHLHEDTRPDETTEEDLARP